VKATQRFESMRQEYLHVEDPVVPAHGSADLPFEQQHVQAHRDSSNQAVKDPQT
jgi:hypothetical protein